MDGDRRTIEAGVDNNAALASADEKMLLHRNKSPSSDEIKMGIKEEGGEGAELRAGVRDQAVRDLFYYGVCYHAIQAFEAGDIGHRQHDQHVRSNEDEVIVNEMEEKVKPKEQSDDTGMGDVSGRDSGINEASNAELNRANSSEVKENVLEEKGKNEQEELIPRKGVEGGGTSTEEGMHQPSQECDDDAFTMQIQLPQEEGKMDRNGEEGEERDREGAEVVQQRDGDGRVEKGREGGDGDEGSECEAKQDHDEEESRDNEVQGHDAECEEIHGVVVVGEQGLEAKAEEEGKREDDERCRMVEAPEIERDEVVAAKEREVEEEAEDVEEEGMAKGKEEEVALGAAERKEELGEKKEDEGAERFEGLNNEERRGEMRDEDGERKVVESGEVNNEQKATDTRDIVADEVEELEKDEDEHRMGERTSERKEGREAETPGQDDLLVSVAAKEGVEERPCDDTCGTITPRKDNEEGADAPASLEGSVSAVTTILETPASGIDSGTADRGAADAIAQTYKQSEREEGNDADHTGAERSPGEDLLPPSLSHEKATEPGLLAAADTETARSTEASPTTEPAAASPRHDTTQSPVLQLEAESPAAGDSGAGDGEKNENAEREPKNEDSAVVMASVPAGSSPVEENPSSTPATATSAQERSASNEASMLASEKTAEVAHANLPATGPETTTTIASKEAGKQEESHDQVVPKATRQAKRSAIVLSMSDKDNELSEFGTGMRFHGMTLAKGFIFADRDFTAQSVCWTM
jgi:hypothetical protein